jgi:hypothetical protein
MANAFSAWCPGGREQQKTIAASSDSSKSTPVKPQPADNLAIGYES